jgi:cytochrome c-type biogenesis protein
MDPLSIGFLVSALIAGLLTFLAPCTLPLLPGFLGLISGVSANADADDLGPRARRQIMYNGIFFIIGFSVVFIILGVLAGFAGQLLAEYQTTVTRIGGVLIVLFGSYLAGAHQLPGIRAVFRGTTLSIPAFITPGAPMSSFAIGGFFAVGWSPCVGPILGSILTLASAQATAVSGGILLAAFSLGLAIPFLVLAAAYASMTRLIHNLTPFINWISRIGGVFLILLGVLLITDRFELLITYGYELFDFLNYRVLQQYL